MYNILGDGWNKMVWSYLDKFSEASSIFEIVLKGGRIMRSIIYLVGLVVVIYIILRVLGIV